MAEVEPTTQTPTPTSQSGVVRYRAVAVVCVLVAVVLAFLLLRSGGDSSDTASQPSDTTRVPSDPADPMYATVPEPEWPPVIASSFQTQITPSTTLAHPLQPLTLTLTVRNYSGPAQVRLYDARRNLVEETTIQVQQSSATLGVLPRGVLGAQTALVFVDDHLISTHPDIFTLDAVTEVQTGLDDLDRIYPMVHSFMQQDVVSYTLDDMAVRGYRSPDNPLIWLRDHVYQGRGFRYFETDVTSVLDAFRRAQQPDGSFPDVLTHPELKVEAHRLATTADVEFLFVQGVYDAWQMTGDDEWLYSNLDAMRRALHHITSDPLRWDAERGLVRRPYTIDTWDFEYGPTATSPDGKPSPRHWVDDQTIWGIFHGDTTGLAYTMKRMERMERHLGNEGEAREWEQQRVALMERLNAISWNGDFFTHFVPLDATIVITPPVDTDAQLSLSNAYALNREVIDSDQARAIIQSYFDRRDFGRAFAEWYSIDPPFPEGSYGMGGLKGERPGEYVNGGIMPLVGGELARGAFDYGFEEYGFDILRRYADLIHLTGASYLWYYPDGRPGISGPHTLSTDGWGSSAMLGALLEGAAGIIDKQNRYYDIDVSPRWSILPDAQNVRVVTRYAASDGYVAYTWQRTDQGITLALTGTWEQARVRLLLPPDAPKKRFLSLVVNGESREVTFDNEAGSRYIVAETTGSNAKIVLTWQ